MQKLNFDNGMREFRVNGSAVLKFNPSDINVYSRFLDAAEKINKIEEDLVAKGKESGEADGEAVIRLMAEADAEIKKVLCYVFGEHNDFNEIFGGVNVMAPVANGERAITNFLVAITPIIEEGARSYAKAKAGAVVKANRAQRRAKK